MFILLVDYQLWISMMRFPMGQFMSEDKCYNFLVEVLHPEGLKCPNCKTPCEETKIHRRERAPLLTYRCTCGRVFNAWTGTLFQGTQWPPSIWLQVLRDFAQGIPTKRIAEELGLSRTNLLKVRHRMQALLVSFSPDGTVAGPDNRGG